MNNNITESFVKELFNLSSLKISEKILKQTKRCILDYIGVTMFGSMIQSEKINKLLFYSGINGHDATIIGANRKSDIYNTIFINGLSAHTADFDDGANSGIIHLGSPIISAILPAAEKEKISAKQLLKGIIVGYEAALRLAKAIQPYHKERGYHASATCGSIGAAIGLSIALGFDVQKMKVALSSAVVSAGGLLKVLEDGSDLKPFNVARAALNGAISVNMARSGFLGPDDVLYGKTGFLEVLSSKNDITKLETKDEEPYAVEQVYFKPYAACRYCHPAIEGAIKIKENNIIDINEIKQIKVDTYYWAVGKHDHSTIKGITSAKMSTPYSVAVALIYGMASINEFSNERINDNTVLTLAKKVIVEANDRFTVNFPQKCSALVKVYMNDGSTLKEQIDYPKGEPENPLSDQELIDKFKTLARYANKTEEEINQIIDCVMDLENRLDVLYTLL